MRKEITWISPMRTGIIYAVILAVLYFALKIFTLLFAVFAADHYAGGFAHMQGGEGAVPMILGAGLLESAIRLIPAMIGGFFAGLISVFIYNVASGIVGGVVIELRDR